MSKKFYEIGLGVNFIKVLCHNLCPLRGNYSQNFRQYTYSSVTYTKESFMKFTWVSISYKFFVVNYAPLSIIIDKTSDNMLIAA
jgi:hypothetical protein